MERASRRVRTPKRIRRSLSEWFEGERIPNPDDPEEALTYDALLSLRGWGAIELDTARPDFLAAARHALYAERLMPILERARELQDMNMDAVSRDDKLRVGKAKMQARRLIPALREALYLDHDDGE